jgi:hypothetical protein
VGEAPEEIMTADRVIAVAGATWLLLFITGVNAAG